MGFIVYLFLSPVLEIFLGFTFTDLEDFMPLLSLIVGIVLIVVICRRKDKASAGLTLSLYLLSLWAILPNISLYFMARQLQSVAGSWPGQTH